MKNEQQCNGLPGEPPAQSASEQLPPVTASNAQDAAALMAIPAEYLFRGRNRVAILHAGEIYYLRITRQNRLILNK